MAQSPDSVKEAVAVVSADELNDAEMPAQGTGASEAPATAPAHQKFYSDFVKQYFNLYRAKFEPFRQKEDKQLTRDEFDDAFLDTPARLESIKKGELNFGQDKADLETLLKVMSEAAGKPATTERLQRYRNAKKVSVAKKVQRTRTEYRRGWDSYSTACSGWYYDPMGCPVRRAVQVPYTETVHAMEFAKGTQSHTQIFRAFQDRFYALLNERRENNADEAAAKRADIVAGKLEGQQTIGTALWVAGAFLVLMFFFLLIAIERHQRRMSSEA